LERGLKSEKGFDAWDISIQAKGRMLNRSYRFKGPFDRASFQAFVSEYEKGLFDKRCSDKMLTTLNAFETHTFYSSGGERLTSFSINPADCPW
jgi:hypothetical protein